jgi:hypothetical protein
VQGSEKRGAHLLLKPKHSLPTSLELTTEIENLLQKSFKLIILRTDRKDNNGISKSLVLDRNNSALSASEQLLLTILLIAKIT